MSQPAPFQPSKGPYAADGSRDSSSGALMAVILIAALLLLLVFGGLFVLGLVYARVAVVRVTSPPATATAPPAVTPAPVAVAPPMRPTPPPLPGTVEANPSPPALPATATAGVDLLKKFDATRDIWRGKIEARDGLLVTQRGRPDTILLGHAPGDSYDLEIELLRRDSREGMFVGIIVDGRQAMVNVDGFPEAGYRSGLDQIDGKRIQNPSNPTVTEGKLLPENEKRTLLIEVRGKHVTAKLGDKIFIDWQGDGSRLSLFGLFSTADQKQMFLGTWDAQYEFSKIELRAR
jgi:hypothetical protein